LSGLPKNLKRFQKLLLLIIAFATKKLIVEQEFNPAYVQMLQMISLEFLGLPFALKTILG